MGKPSFTRLWNLYPTNINPNNKSPCNGPWRNQCAIRMSICLNAEKSIQINSTTYSEPKCSHGHARGAESLANWLWKHHLRRPKIYLDGKQAKQDIKNKTGIIFLKIASQGLVKRTQLETILIYGINKKKQLHTMILKT